MLGAYLTLAETGRVLGVESGTVRDLIVNGPLVGIEREDGLMVHEEDLRSFRRPLGIATTSDSSTPNGSEVNQCRNPMKIGVVFRATGNYSLIIGPCGPERWAAVPGSDRHEVSTCGRIRSWLIGKKKARLDHPIAVKPRIIAEGYLGFGKQSRLHAAILEAFVGPCPEGFECAHRNGDKHDDCLVNLRWATRAENVADKMRHGTCSARTRPNLTQEQRAEIRRRREAGESRSSVAKAFDVTPQTISHQTRLRLVRP